MKRNQLGEGTSFHLGSRRRRQAGCGYGMIWAIVIHCPVKPGRNDTKLQPTSGSNIFQHYAWSPGGVLLELPWHRDMGEFTLARSPGSPETWRGQRINRWRNKKFQSTGRVGWETIMNFFDFRGKFSVGKWSERIYGCIRYLCDLMWVRRQWQLRVQWRSMLTIASLETYSWADVSVFCRLSLSPSVLIRSSSWVLMSTLIYFGSLVTVKVYEEFFPQDSHGQPHIWSWQNHSSRCSAQWRYAAACFPWKSQGAAGEGATSESPEKRDLSGILDLYIIM